MTESSVYISCVEASRALLDEPQLRVVTDGPAGIFTELDVVLLAARSACRGMNERQREEWMDQAPYHASQAMGMLWRTSRAARYGPVHLPEVNKPDYMRIASKIVYSHPNGPAAITTPNGRFPRIMVSNDPAKSPGRRYGTDRTDLEPWEDQPSVVTGQKQKSSSLQMENNRLRAENAALRAEIEQLRSQVIPREKLEALLRNA